MKLVVTSSEIQAVKNLCVKDKVVAGTLLSALDEDYFHNKYVKEVFRRILIINKRTGDLPTWSEVINDPAIKEDTRAKLKEYDVERIKTPEAARNLAALLNQYRQLRGSFKLAEEITESLKNKSVEVDDLLNKISGDLVALRQNRGETSSVTTFGVGNNATSLVKSLLDPETQNFIPTGMASFDNENGGIGWGNLMVVGGTSGGGKCCTKDTNLIVVKLVRITHDDGNIEELTPNEYRKRYLET
jgi:replicative DNA helicase